MSSPAFTLAERGLLLRAARVLRESSEDLLELLRVDDANSAAAGVGRSAFSPAARSGIKRKADGRAGDAKELDRLRHKLEAQNVPPAGE